MKKTVTIAAFISVVIFIFVLVSNILTTNRHIVGHLKRAADANTVDMAISELDLVIGYLEETGKTTGTTEIFGVLQMPKHEVDFWYRNIKNSVDELKKLPFDATPLEKSNMLMKLRETLADSSEDGVTVTMPPHMATFPNQKGYFWWCIISLVVCFAGGFLWHQENMS